MDDPGSPTHHPPEQAVARGSAARLWSRVPARCDILSGPPQSGDILALRLAIRFVALASHDDSSISHGAPARLAA
jgi:hypothetical protein